MEGGERKDICQQFSIGKDNLILKSLQVNMQPRLKKLATRGFVTKSAKSKHKVNVITETNKTRMITETMQSVHVLSLSHTTGNEIEVNLISHKLLSHN